VWKNNPVGRPDQSRGQGINHCGNPVHTTGRNRKKLAIGKLKRACLCKGGKKRQRLGRGGHQKTVDQEGHFGGKPQGSMEEGSEASQVEKPSVRKDGKAEKKRVSKIMPQNKGWY